MTIQQETALNVHDFNKDDDKNSSNGGKGGTGKNNGSGNGGSTGGNASQGTPLGSIPSGGTSTKTGSDDLPLIDYNKKAKDGKFNEALFRDAQIMQVLGVLCTKKKPNALIVGDAGVGKTQIVEELARRIVEKDPIVSSLLKGVTIYELPISQLVAGKSYVGQLEQSVNDIIAFASDPANKAVLFIDEIHQLMNDHDSTSEKIAQILKPAMARGDIRIIGATTTSEATSFLRDPAFSRRMTQVMVPELSPEQTIEVVKAIRPSLNTHHNVTLSDDILEQAVVIGDEYRQYGSHRPDTTITLIDRAMADARIERKELEEQGKKDPVLKQFLAQNPIPNLTMKQVKKSAMRILTGDTKTNDNRVARLEDNLNNKIIGQSGAKDALVNAVRRQDLNLVRRTRPISFLFAGPTGTGKTEVSKQLADALFGSRDNMIYVNLSEYSSDASLTRITGSSDGYVGSNSKRELPFDSLETRPYQVVLLDEFEKAAKNVQRFFMQALDDGKVQSNRGKDIDFSRTIVIATTNAGSEILSEKTVGFGQQGRSKASNASQQDVITALKDSFDMELINRFEHIIGFESLESDDYTKVLAVKFNQLISEAQENRQDLTFSPLHIDLDDAINFDFMVELTEKSYQSDLNGRPAERTMREYIEDTLIDNPNNTQFVFQ